MAKLVDKYRPRRLSQIIGQEKTTSRLEAMLRRGALGGSAVWIEGPSGTGKTSIAQCLARALGAGPDNAVRYSELDGDKCRAEIVRDLDAAALEVNRAVRSFGHVEQAHVWVVNEAHAMTARAVQAWLTLLDGRLPAAWTVVFTTTESREDLFGNFAGPFASRVVAFRLTSQGLSERFARFARAVAVREGLDGRDLTAYARLVKDEKNNLRAVLQRIDSGAMMAAD